MRFSQIHPYVHREYILIYIKRIPFHQFIPTYIGNTGWRDSFTRKDNRFIPTYIRETVFQLHRIFK